MWSFGIRVTQRRGADRPAFVLGDSNRMLWFSRLVPRGQGSVSKDMGKPAAAVVSHLVPALFGADMRPDLAQCFELQTIARTQVLIPSSLPLPCPSCQGVLQSPAKRAFVNLAHIPRRDESNPPNRIIIAIIVAIVVVAVVVAVVVVVVVVVVMYSSYLIPRG